MRIEISSAAQFLVDLVRLNTTASALTEEQLDRFRSNVSDLLQRHYTNHWFPDKPFKGSGYRCIRINGKMDPLIARAGFMMGLAVSFLRSLFPTELTMWVDPREVSYRIGENGSICILYEGIEIKTKADVMPPAAAPTETSAKTPEKSVQQQAAPATPPASQQQQQQAPSPPPALPQHHQPPPPQQQQQVHHHHQQQQHHHHQQQQQQQQQQHHHHQQQHHFSPSKSVVVSSPLHLSRPMSPITSQLSQQQNQQQHQQAAAAAMQLSMFLMNKESGLIKCKESLQRGLEVARPLQMDRLFVSS